MKIIVGVLIVLLLAACGGNMDDSPRAANRTQVEGTYIVRSIDKEAGVVCWQNTTYNSSGGIFCMPLSQTKLDK
jgi:hypothetical protein